MSVIPLSMIGVFLGLLILQQPLSFSSLLGIIALAGVIINHSIILMDAMHRMQEDNPEYDHKKVVVEASITRLRPIILTTITTCVGMIPLMTVSSLWSPLATAIMFGLGFSTILTLALIPILYFRWPGKAVLEKYEETART
jgi:multidrug efflux pump subunit AcrB